MARATLHPDPLLKPAIAFGALIGFAILVAAFGPRADLPRPWKTTEATQSIELAYADEPGGAVVVSDAATGQPITRLEVGEGGFVRSTMRNLARERIRRGIPREPPFLLASYAEGTLLLSDPQTGRSIDLAAFGGENQAAFAEFLDHGRQK